jgi:hypothetical protein
MHKSSTMANNITRIARVVASKDKGKDSQMYAIKDAIKTFPGIRVDYRGMERVNGENAHIFNLLVTKGTESRYEGLIAMIGDTFYQGNQFVIYKWVDRSTPTPAPTPSPTQAQLRNAAARVGYKMSSTWGVEPFDPSIQPLRFEKRA